MSVNSWFDLSEKTQLVAGAKRSIGFGMAMVFAKAEAPGTVKINAIASSIIDTDNTQALRNDPVRSKFFLDRIPANRPGTPEDVAGAAIYLASPALDYVHRSIRTIDGGWLGR